MSIVFLKAPESENLQDFEKWLNGEGFLLTQIAQASEVSGDANCFDYLPCIARIALGDDDESEPVVLTEYNGNIIVWNTLEDELEYSSDVLYWVAVNDVREI
jgi:hypothetical protein